MSDLHREEMQKRYMPRNYGILADIAKNDMNLKTSEVSFNYHKTDLFLSM